MDKPDRQFHSIAAAFKGCVSNDSDCKELTPEWYYLPAFLVNTNGVDFGVKGSGVRIADVVLPPWAHGSAEAFIAAQRAALESDFVSAHLHEWVDLIFGVKQRGPFLPGGSVRAEEACNCFFHLMCVHTARAAV